MEQGAAAILKEFPTAGLWKLDAYIDEEQFGSIMVGIK